MTQAYDAAGNRIQKEQNGAVETYLYDSRNRLLERTEGTKKVRYMYDAAGNLTQEQYDRINAGGQTERTEQTEEIRYAYDTFGRTSEVHGSTFQQKNRYDAEGFRYELEENKKVSRFVYHRGMMLAELDERNQVTGSQYLGNGYIGGYLSERKEESIRSGQSDEKGSISKETGKGFSSGSGVDLISKERELCYYIRDEQGSVRYVVDQSGNVVNEYQYSAFGETERAEERYENRLRYNGQMYDGLTEQYYLRARYYQPKTGRFTQEDFLYEDGLNLYVYCKSNPVMYCDPSGLAGRPLSDGTCNKKVKAEGDGEDQRVGKLSDKIDGNSYDINKLEKTQPYTYLENVSSIKDTIAQNGPNAVPPIEIRVDHGRVFVVDGHHRLEAFRQLGYDRVPIKYLHSSQLGKTLSNGTYYRPLQELIDAAELCK